ncbi:MAG: hypothetical protein M1308_06975 [Actinobacteria bacterium]|nr:hypothetical protein [Actinomycetota bacterium]
MMYQVLAATGLYFGNPPCCQGDTRGVRYLFCILKACGDGSTTGESDDGIKLYTFLKGAVSKWKFEATSLTCETRLNGAAVITTHFLSYTASLYLVYAGHVCFSVFQKSIGHLISFTVNKSKSKNL